MSKLITLCAVLAGMLAMIYIVRGVFTRSLKKETADSLSRMTYGVVCFATLFSFMLPKLAAGTPVTV